MIRIYGTMTDPSGSPVPGAIIELRAINSTSEVLLGSTVTHKCDQQGAYSFQLATGTYDAYAQNDRCGDMDYLGTARVSANSIDGDLHSILIDGGITITSPILESALAAAQRAESAAALTAADQVSAGQNAESAKADSAAAKTSSGEAISAASTAVFAKESIIADARNVRTLATQVSTQATDVSAKHGDVVVKAQQVSAQTDIVSSKHGEVVTKAVQASEDVAATQAAKNISVAAADTATQKAASAATHDASAQDAAARAENAASIVVGAVLDGGECDLSGGVYPQPITVAGKKYSTIWYVAVAGTVSDVTFDVGDLLRYTTARTGYYFKIDAKDEVYSVNDEKGAVTITPEKIGAERTGVAQQLTEQHSSKDGAHSISGVAGLERALSSKYSPSNKPSASDIGAIPTSGGECSGNLSALGSVISKGGYMSAIRDAYPMFEWHIPGKHAAIAYLTETGDLRFANSNGSAGEVAPRCIMSPDGLFSSARFSSNTSGIGLYNSAATIGEGAGIVRGEVQGGSWNDWRSRAAALLVDCQHSSSSAHLIWKATHWGKAHLAGMDVHSPSSDGSNVMVSMHVGATTNAFTFNHVGQAYAVGGWLVGSDAKFKRKIKRLGDNREFSWLDVIRSFRASSFEYKTERNRTRLGFIAQDVVKHLPAAVCESESSHRGRLFVDEMAIIAAQHEAINEIADTIDELKSQIATLLRSNKRP